jgi:hypothetical protein
MAVVVSPYIVAAGREYVQRCVDGIIVEHTGERDLSKLAAAQLLTAVR